MKGLGELRTPQDLFGKLERDLARIEKDDSDSAAAFDFFVTAYHMIDWIVEATPGADLTATRQKLMQEDPHLAIAGHIANGAKHYEARRWSEVVASEVQLGAWGRAWAPDTWAKGAWGDEGLVFVLSEEQAKRFGRPILGALDCARSLVAYWKRKVKPLSVD